jgi:hypothetical protein
MDYKRVLKAIWNKSKLSFFLSFFSVTLLYLRGFIVRPFRFVPAKLRDKLHAMASVPFSPDETQKSEFEFAARQALLIFGMDNDTILQETYPGYDEYHVGEERDVRYTLITDNQNRHYHVGIRGSENEQNWVDNFTPEFVQENELNATIHRGYRDIALSLLEPLEPLLQNKDYKITVAGGSLGGVSSVAVGWYLDSRGYDVKKIYNFAGPRLTDDDYSHLNILTVVNKLDAVWMLPLATPLHRYRHQGERVLIIPALDYQSDKGSAEWRLYEDSLLSDFLLSSWGIDRKLDSAEHITYGSYFLRFLGKEQEPGVF